MGYSAEKKTTFYVNDITISLKGNNPVFMSGKSTQSGVGHAWVVDGCDSYTTINEYYNKDTGELYGSYGGIIYTYLHFNIGRGDSRDNAYYLYAGGGVSGYDAKDFSTFEYTLNNQIITNIKR